MAQHLPKLPTRTPGVRHDPKCLGRNLMEGEEPLQPKLMYTSVIANTESGETTWVAQSPPENASLDKDEAFHILQNTRRRAVLRHMIAEGQEQYVMREMAEAVAAWEEDCSIEQLTSDQRQRVYISLYQSHLPKLDDCNLIEYDQDRGVVKPRPSIALLEPFLDDGLEAEPDLVLNPDGNEGGPQRPRSLSSFFARLRR